MVEPDSVQAPRPFSLVGVEKEVLTLQYDAQQLRGIATHPGTVAVHNFPLRADLSVDLELTPFHVASPLTRVVLGRKEGADEPLDYNPGRLSFFRGRVDGRAGSHVFFAFSDRIFTGSIHLGPGAEQFRISEKDYRGLPLPSGRLSVFEPRSDAGLPAGVPKCGVKGGFPHPADSTTDPVMNENLAIAGTTPRVGLQHLELAVETDYEYFSLFGDATAATDYVLLMYGAVSDIYMRDVDTRIQVVFVRIWTDPNDIINGEDPLQEFRAEWLASMGGVARDNAQFFSGRRDFPFGGQAYLSSLCSTNIGYGVVGYALGFFPDPTRPDPYTWDVSVSAHELGHSCSAHHTHDLGIDQCDNPTTTPQRGSIMSYCSQTWSGMNANDDSFFHTANRMEMRNHIFSRTCIADDCNLNNTEDSTDIGMATSPDVNENGVPDECEDCQPNGTLDPTDIAGASDDDNGDGIPDECQPDCNMTGLPDDLDISLGTTDAYGDGIPDSCEEDCNENSISDYTEINLNMPLDKDRNARLDSCQNCDGDGPNDLIELGGAHNLWVASGLDFSDIQQFFASTGVAVNNGGASAIRGAQDLIVTSDGRVLVTSALDNSVLQYSDGGGFLGSLVSSGSGGLTYPTGLIISPAGSLLVASRETNSVLAYHAVTGAPLGAFVAAGDGGLVGPFGLAFGPNGNLFVTSATNEILEYHGVTGAFVKKFIRASRNGGLSQPRGLIHKSDGNLLVASYGTDEVLEFDGETGLPLGKWAKVGTTTAITQDSPWGIRVGPNGNVYVTRTGTPFSSSPQVTAGDVGESHLTDARMFEFNVCTGNHRRTHIGGNDHGLFFPTGFDFRPGWTLDCNRNQLQDDCDIANNTSQDVNENGIPDECEVDCNGNTRWDNLDLIPFGTSYDCNCNRIPDECEPSTVDCDGNGVPDKCEDCDGNGIGDGCDIMGGAPDCNLNGILDACEPARDCNGNTMQDICDIFNGAADCNENDWLDSCEAAGGGLILDEDFESGLPPGWSTFGIFQVTGACEVGTPCSPAQWAYAGNTGSCSYGDNEFGELDSPAIALANAPAELRFCSFVDSEAGYDFADLYVNGQLVSREAGPILQWNSHSVDLTPFAGQVITITFLFASDSFVSGTLGWQVDNIELISGSRDCDGDGLLAECEVDCNENGIGDDCDIADGTSPDQNGDGVPDECAPPPPINNIVWRPAGRCTGAPFGPCADNDDCPAGTTCDLWPNDDPEATTRSLRFRVVESVPGPQKFEAIKVTMVDLMHPDPRNLIQYPPPNYSTFDTGTASRCSGATTSPNRNGHHCTVSDPDCLGGNGAVSTDDGTCSPTAACTAAGGCAVWVGQPWTFYEAQGPPLSGPYRASRLQCTPKYWDWKAEAGGLVTVVGAEIIPSSEYSVQLYASTCLGDGTGCTDVSTPVSMYTRRKGDVDSPFQMPAPAALTQADVLDISQAVASVKHVAGSPAHYRGQMQANLPELNSDANVLDIVEAVDSVKRLPYSFSGPCVCPSTQPCGASCTGCAGLCLKKCVGGDNDGQTCVNNTHCPGVCVGGSNPGVVCPSGVPGGVNCAGGGVCSGVCSATGTCYDKCGRCTP